jgi:hypothetical protein
MFTTLATTMMPTSKYMIILGRDLTTAEQIQEIAGLSSPPECRSVERLQGDDEEDEDDEDEPEGCCIVDAATRTALIEWQKRERRSIKLMVPFTEVGSTSASEPAAIMNALRSYPVPYFFYGTLAEPDIVAGIVELDELPALKKELVRGWKMMMSGKCKALVKAGSGEVVERWVYIVENEEDLGRLATYEGSNYEVQRCEILDEDGRKLEGNVFVFCGDSRLLQDTPREGQGAEGEEE